jgi:hypothetical protein
MELLDTRCKSWHVFLIQPPKTSCRRRGRGPAKRVRPIAHRPGMEAERLEVELGALRRGDDDFLVTGGWQVVASSSQAGGGFLVFYDGGGWLQRLMGRIGWR